MSKIKAKPNRKGPINKLNSITLEDKVELTEPVSPAVNCLISKFLTKRISTHLY